MRCARKPSPICRHRACRPFPPVSQPAVAPRLSIVVLPFANLSDDSEQQYFTDGITDDVTADLSRIDGSFVISRGTAFTYKDKAFDAKQIGRELGVRFVLEGSARRSGDLVRVNAQLIDAETAGHLWAERFDRHIGDLFAVQDEITRRIATALNLELAWAEAARPFDHPDALDYFFRGRAAGAQAKTRDNHAEAIALYEHALALDPRSVEAQSHLASELAGRVLNNMTDSRDADVARAAELAGQALAAAPRSPSAHFAKGQALRAQGRPAEAIPEYETVIESDRNCAARHIRARLVQTLHRVDGGDNPRSRSNPSASVPAILYLGASPISGSALAHLLQSRSDDAIPWLEKGRDAIRGIRIHHAWLASAHALKGEPERAAAELAEARRLSSDDRYSSLARLKAMSIVRAPEGPRLVRSHLLRRPSAGWDARRMNAGALRRLNTV